MSASLYTRTCVLSSVSTHSRALPIADYTRDILLKRLSFRIRWLWDFFLPKIHSLLHCVLYTRTNLISFSLVTRLSRHLSTCVFCPSLFFLLHFSHFPISFAFRSLDCRLNGRQGWFNRLNETVTFCCYCLFALNFFEFPLDNFAPSVSPIFARACFPLVIAAHSWHLFSKTHTHISCTYTVKGNVELWFTF